MVWGNYLQSKNNKSKPSISFIQITCPFEMDCAEESILYWPAKIRYCWFKKSFLLFPSPVKYNPLLVYSTLSVPSSQLEKPAKICLVTIWGLILNQYSVPALCALTNKPVCNHLRHNARNAARQVQYKAWLRPIGDLSALPRAGEGGRGSREVGTGFLWPLFIHIETPYFLYWRQSRLFYFMHKFKVI